MVSRGSPTIGIVDYGSGNLRSVHRAMEHAGGLCTLVRSPSDAERCKALVVPGVGSFGDCASQLKQIGLWDYLGRWISDDRPYLGICLGYQLLFDSSEESPGVQGFGILAGKAVHFPRVAGLKIPHMGWNQLHITNPSDPLMTGLGVNPDFYFVHSYYPVPEEKGVITSTCDYGLEFAASITRGKLSAVQFHPEKSQEIGLRMLRNFIATID